MINSSLGSIPSSMEKPKYHELVAPIKEIGELVMGWAKDVICPPEAVDLPRGGGPLLDEYISGPRSVPPANPGDWDSLRGV